MKKIFMLLIALVAYCGGAMADGLEVQDVNISQGGEATLEIALENPVTAFAAFQFNVELAEGITVATNDKGKFVYEKGERLDEEFSLSLSQPDALVNTYRVLGYYTETQPIPSTTGAIVKITIKADATLAIGTTHVCKLSAINLTETNETKHTPDDITFNVKITEKTYTILDETSTTAPAASGGPVDIQVKRTIKANEWSTLVLPFDMTEAQLKEALGSDVKLAEFEDYEAEYTGDDVTGLTVNFVATDLTEGFYGNYPYLVKTSKDITEFIVTSTIDPDEEGAVVEYDNGKSGKQRKVLGSLIGTYHAGDAIPNNGLFLSGNKFWYSAGATKIKAFRAYFMLNEVLSGVAEAKVRFMVDEDAAAIEGITPDMENGVWYTLDGRQLNGKPTEKGVYIVDGKKVLIK
jgi:hypothetical protein